MNPTAADKHRKGAELSMRLLSSTAFAAAGLGAMLLTAGAVAGPTVYSWDVQHTQTQDRVRVKWSEATNVQVESFPAARQVVVTIPEGRLEGGISPLAPAEGSLLEKARIQDVTLADGRNAVQMTLATTADAKADAVAGAGYLTVSLERNSAEPKPASTVPTDVILLSNADIEDLKAGKYGSERAPEYGAGQAGDASSPFYVPADLTAEQKAAQVGGRDIGMINTMGLFERFVDLDFKNAELQDVIRAISGKLELNIIINPTLTKGQVTVKLRNVRLGDALEGLLKSNDLAYKVETGGIVRIVERKDVMSKEKETIVQSVAINWIDASEVEKVLKPFLTPQIGQITTAESTNLLVIEDVPDKVREMQQLIYRMDVPEKQVKMEVRLVDMSDFASRALGFRTDFTQIPEDGLGDTANGFLAPVVGEDGALGVGDDGSLTSALYPANSGFFGNPGLNVTSLEDVKIFGNRYAVSMKIDALERRQEAVTLANPTILSLNNKEAEIEIKRQVPYQDAVNTAQGSVATIKFQDVGTKVTVLPRITNNGYVQMEIEPEQKIDVGRALAGDGSEGVPIIDERNAVTSVIVRDEQTVALGGLRQFESSLGENGVPWLLRAPVVKWLFKSQTNSQRKLELYLFVTPHIIKDPEPTSYEQGMYEKIDYNWDLPDYYFDEVVPRKGPRETPDPYTKIQ